MLPSSLASSLLLCLQSLALRRRRLPPPSTLADRLQQASVELCSSLIPIGLDLHLFLKEKREPCVGFLTPREPLAESLIDDARSRESKGGGGGHRGSGETRSSSARVHLAPASLSRRFCSRCVAGIKALHLRLLKEELHPLYSAAEAFGNAS